MYQKWSCSRFKLDSDDMKKNFGQDKKDKPVPTGIFPSSQNAIKVSP